jgi:GTP-binding protein
MCTVNHTLTVPGGVARPGTPVDPPTLAMTFGVNDSPFAGQDGTMLTSNMIYDRLARECDSNVSLQLVKTDSDAVEVRGRGELQLGILLEQMRREGFEIAVSSPRVLLRADENGKQLEPIEEVGLLLEPI